MSNYTDEDFVEDLLDMIPASFPPLLDRIYEEALSRYAKVLEAHVHDATMLSKYIVIHHSETYSVRRMWAEDSELDGGQLPAQMYYWNKFKQITSAYISFAGGYQFIDSAIHSILSRHRYEDAIKFINRAWVDKMIIIDEHACFSLWMLIRSIVFGIDYHESQQEYFQARKAAYPSEQTNDEAGVNLHKIVQEIAKINLSKDRDFNGLIDYYWELRQASELTLGQARGADTYSSWIKAIRNLLPSYMVLQLLADEATFCLEREEDRRDLISLSRFVDERKADILTSMRMPFWVVAYHDIETSEDQRSRLRRARFYNAGRVVFPHFIFEKLTEMIKADHSDLSSIEHSITASIRPGHKWFLDILIV